MILPEIDKEGSVLDVVGKPEEKHVETGVDKKPNAHTVLVPGLSSVQR